jgi:hypothetical protein
MLPRVKTPLPKPLIDILWSFRVSNSLHPRKRINPGNLYWDI